MRIISRKNLKKVSALMIITCMVLLNSNIAYAQGNPTISTQQLNDVLLATKDTVDSLNEMGFDVENIKNMLELSGNIDADSINTLNETIDMLKMKTVYDYDGNPPKNDGEQVQRLCNVYSVALSNPSNYYEGSLSSAEDFGKYIVYLYISHYIDGPGRAPTADDLPYIISSSDISAYNTFLSTSNLSSLFSGIASLASACYTDFDYTRTVKGLSDLNSELKDKIGLIYAATNGVYDIASTKSALKVISEKTLWYYNNYYTSGVNEQKFQKDTLDYVKSQLKALNFYKDYDENISDSLTGIIISVIWSVVTSTISTFGLLVAALPFFVYSFTGLIQTAVLVNLGYSFSGRYAIRTGIYLDF